MANAEPSDTTASQKPFTSGFAGGMTFAIVMILIGFVIIVGSLQSDVINDNANGSLFGVAVGSLFAGIGQLLFTVYAIAQAVYMGVSRAHDREAHILGA
jgi:hypothetical protein